MSKTFKYIILSSILLFGASLQVAAQQKAGKKDAKKDVKKDSVALWQGVMFEFDVAPFVERALFQKHAYSFQGNAQVNLKNKFFPVTEIGFSGANKTSSNEAAFVTNGLFGKLGVDVRVIQPKPDAIIKDNFFLAGIRFGMSHFNYSLSNIKISDGYWGGEEVINQDKLSATKFWFEITAGVKVSIYKNIYMGWTARNKHLINNPKAGEYAPWHIPGYGLGNSSVWGFSYTIGYYLR